MPNETSMRFMRASLSVALVASVICAGLTPAFAQTVQKNSDGSVEAYDEGDSAQSESVDSGGSNNTMQKGYRAGTSPYQKKLSDGTTVKRNADGTIETWDEGETQHYSGGLPVTSSSHKRTTKHRTTSKAKTAKVTTSSTVKKKTK